MNLLFVVIVAIPLGLYLLVLIASTRDFSPDGTPSTHSADPVAPTFTDVIQAAAVAPVSSEDTRAAESAVTEPSRIEEPSVTAQDPNNSVAEVATADNTPISAGTEVEAVVIPASREPGPESTDIVPTALDQEIAPNAQPPSPATPEQTAESNSTDVSPQADHDAPSEPILSGQPLILAQDAPKYAFDYRGRLWVEKKRRGFFRQLRRPQLPPDDPTNPPDR